MENQTEITITGVNLNEAVVPDRITFKTTIQNYNNA